LPARKYGGLARGTPHSFTIRKRKEVIGMSSVADQLLIFITTYGIKIIGAILILALGRIAAGLGRKIVKRVLEKSKTDPAIVSIEQNCKL
jgi:hypothetical protein